MMNFQLLRVLAELAGLKVDWDEAKAWAVAVLPLAEKIAATTATTTDDQIVAILRSIVQRPTVGGTQPTGGESPFRKAMRQTMTIGDGSGIPPAPSSLPQETGAGRIRSKIDQRIRDRLRDRALENGAPAAAVDAALDEMESDRPFLDWLLNGGFEKLLELILRLIPLFI